MGEDCGVILSLKNVNVYYQENKRALREHVIHDVSFDIKKGEIVALVGESGSGKSTLARAILGMEPLYDGIINIWDDNPQMIFQDAYSSLNPSKTVGWILEEPLKMSGIKDRDARERKVYDILDKINLDRDLAGRKPGALSGGQRQRICIAIALLQGSKFIVADEAVSALDAFTQKQIVGLLLKLRDEYGLSILFITHDLRVVRMLCDRVMVMKGGRIVEDGRVSDILSNPKHEYTKELLNASFIN